MHCPLFDDAKLFDNHLFTTMYYNLIHVLLKRGSLESILILQGGMEGFAEIIVSVKDVDDNDPVFGDLEYTLNVNEEVSTLSVASHLLLGLSFHFY